MDVLTPIRGSRGMARMLSRRSAVPAARARPPLAAERSAFAEDLAHHAADVVELEGLGQVRGARALEERALVAVEDVAGDEGQAPAELRVLPHHPLVEALAVEHGHARVAHD